MNNLKRLIKANKGFEAEYTVFAGDFHPQDNAAEIKESIVETYKHWNEIVEKIKMEAPEEITILEAYNDFDKNNSLNYNLEDPDDSINDLESWNEGVLISINTETEENANKLISEFVKLYEDAINQYSLEIEFNGEYNKEN